MTNILGDIDLGAMYSVPGLAFSASQGQRYGGSNHAVLGTGMSVAGSIGGGYLGHKVLGTPGMLIGSMLGSALPGAVYSAIPPVTEKTSNEQIPQQQEPQKSSIIPKLVGGALIAGGLYGGYKYGLKPQWALADKFRRIRDMKDTNPYLTAVGSGGITKSRREGDTAHLYDTDAIKMFLQRNFKKQNFNTPETAKATKNLRGTIIKFETDSAGRSIATPESRKVYDEVLRSTRPNSYEGTEKLRESFKIKHDSKILASQNFVKPTGIAQNLRHYMMKAQDFFDTSKAPATTQTKTSSMLGVLAGIPIGAGALYGAQQGYNYAHSLPDSSINPYITALHTAAGTVGNLPLGLYYRNLANTNYNLKKENPQYTPVDAHMQKIQTVANALNIPHAL